ncbi:glycosyltransferase family A protein [Flavobacterium sp. DG2-3]|uniref:glycosyltransferase family 2 protein n=1 Tax=Flavobacterium sp. DG2-3 TaxID=3068317 RepID=UPI00273ED3CD|nr:glycosyltransferase family A protein [Flavobacterium sp. DG2-3]MDP5200684.1 glycosyltransferase family A protein [Flavobacterium sp. DG2-3]
MISIVIRNKNEAKALGATLTMLNKVYAEDIDEIIIVDNNSTDESITVAEKFNCKIVKIDVFTYGKAINLGIEIARNNLVLLLSSHAIPVGNSFFKNSLKEFNRNSSLAGIRYINSYTNYLRANDNDFTVKDGLKYGLMAGCAMINKEIWKNFKFDEQLVFSEDKQWSERVIKAGLIIKDFNETFFYHIKRDEKSLLSRLKNETIAHYQLHQLEYLSVIKILLIFGKKIMLNLPAEFFQKIIFETKLLRTRLEIRKKILKN